MKKYYRAILFFYLLVSFISFDTIAQEKTEHRTYYELYLYQSQADVQERRYMRQWLEASLQRDFEQKLSETICNSSYLAEATGEDVRSELIEYENSFLNWLFFNPLKDRLVSFVESNNTCDAETGDRPLHLALNAGASPSVVSTLITFGSLVSVANNEGITPVDIGAPYIEDHFSDIKTNKRISNISISCPPDKELRVTRRGDLVCQYK